MIGRERELAHLLELSRDAKDGRGRLALIAGETGIGKTTLAREVAARAAVAGMIAVWGRSWERGAPAYWAWIRVLREALAEWRRIGGAGSSAEIDSWQGHLATMIGELGPMLADPGVIAAGRAEVPAPPEVPPSADPQRFRLFDAVSSFLHRLAAVVPVVIVLDDMHAADSDTLLLLNFVARDLPRSAILILATYRSQDLALVPGRAEIMADIAREGVTIPLGGLDEREIEDLIKERAGVAADRVLTASLLNRTAGNPLFLEHIARLGAKSLESGGAGNAQLGSIPQDSMAAVEQRLIPLSGSTRTVLKIASAMADEIELPLLARVCNLPDEALNASLSEAISAGLLSRVASDGSAYRFNHGLVAETLRAGMTGAELARTHGLIAAALETLHATNLEGCVERLAYHYVEASGSAPAEKAVEYTRRAAESSRRRLAYTEAVRLYQLALRALASLDKPKPTLECETLLSLGEAQNRAGDLAGARDSFGRAASISQGIKAHALFARAVLGRANATLSVAVADENIISSLGQAAAALGEGDGKLKALLLARLSREVFWTDRRDQAFSLSREAVDLARRAGDQPALVTSLWYRHWVLWSPDDTEQRLANASEIVRLAEQCEEWDLVLQARQFRVAALLELGEIDLVVGEIEACTRAEAKVGSSSGMIERFRIMRALLEGNFEQAERKLVELFAIGQRRGDPVLMITFAGQFSQLRGDQGRLEELESLLRKSAAENPGFATTRCGLAFLYARAGRRSEAKAEFEFLAADDFARVRRDWNWLGSIALLSAVAGFLNDTPRSGLLYSMLSPFAGRSATLGWGDVYYGPVTYYLGILATAMGQFERAQVHFEAALRLNHKIGARPSLARTQLRYGAMLLARGDFGDPEHALKLAREAGATAEALGMKALIEEANTMAATAENAASIGGREQRPQQRSGTSAAAPASGTMLATFVFIDLVASTEKAAEMRDRLWAKRLAEYYLTVRDHLQKFHGREVNTSGDGFLAAFDAPARAVRCAASIRDALQGIGLESRFGLHAGECELIGNEFAGMALHIGARVAAIAGAGEVLVSSTVKDLMVGSEVRFVDRGMHRLKGVPDEWRIYLAT